ncbi:hypothetical protein [Sphingomonas sp. Leaf10]|uniref:hypothetical protein n=1 Tax=Sphingomonas sp. Leaf10 TaxID=1735676 RepID=UPI000AAEE0A2|nr:hypothetical protein [Sphingomonas sp. Leaf10]
MRSSKDEVLHRQEYEGGSPDQRTALQGLDGAQGAAQFITMALGRRTLLVGTPSPNRCFEVAWNDRDVDQVNVANHNGFTIETTRQFIVSASERQLDEIRPFLKPELLEARMRTDRVVFRTNAGS